MIPTLYDNFKHWAQTGSVYILSDTHFGDYQCRLIDPGWPAPDDHISMINKIVRKNDTFVCLGDVGNPECVPMIKAGKKILILGNHDKKHLYEDLFDEIYSGPVMISGKILLSHEPVPGLPWCLNIHGHDHNGTTVFPDDCEHLNLASNICGYAPVNLGKLIKDGILSDIESIHRITINKASDRKKNSTCAEVNNPAP